jgi:hypothetical protein
MMPRYHRKVTPLHKKAREDTDWAFENILKFIQYQNDRVNKKGREVTLYIEIVITEYFLKYTHIMIH